MLRRGWMRAIALLSLALLAVLAAVTPALASVTGQHLYYVGASSNPEAVALSPDGLFAYITDRGNKRVHKFNMTTRQFELSVASFASAPQGVAVAPDGVTLWVTVAGTYPTDPSDGGVIGLRTSDLTVSKTLIPVTYAHGGAPTLSGYPTAIVVNAQGTFAYVLGGGSGELYAIDLQAGTVTQHVQLAPDDSTSNDILANLAVSPDGARVFVTSRLDTSSAASDNQVLSVNASDFSDNHALSLPNSWVFEQPTGIAVSPDGNRLYVTDARNYMVSPQNGDNYVYVFDARTEVLETRFEANTSQPFVSNKAVAVSADSSQFVVLNSEQYGSLEFYDSATYALEFTYELGTNGVFLYTANPPQFAINAAGTTVVMALKGEDSLGVYDLDPAVVVPTPTVSSSPTPSPTPTGSSTPTSAPTATMSSGTNSLSATTTGVLSSTGQNLSPVLFIAVFLLVAGATAVITVIVRKRRR